MKTRSVHVLSVGRATGVVDELAGGENTAFSPTLTLAVSREDALARLGETAFDCLVYAADGNGDEQFLAAVREFDPSLPIVAMVEGALDLPPRLYDATDDGTTLSAAVQESITAPANDPPATVHDAVNDADAAADGDDGDVAAPVETYSRHHTPLWENRSFLESVLDNLLDVFFVFTVEQELVEWNVALEDATGRSATDLAGADPLSFLASEDRDDAFASLAEVLTKGRATAAFHIVSDDGDRAPYEFTASLITEDGAPKYICGIGRDVTDLAQKQEELDRVIAELERSNTELEQFAYAASHDMKEPLRMVTSYLQILELRYGDQLDQDAHEFIEFAADGARRMKLMIDQLLTYSRIDRKGGKFRTVDCTAALETTMRNLAVAVEESDAEIEVGTLPTVTGDRDQVVQLFQNLVGNAIKYNRGTPHVEIDAVHRDAFWEFSVADNGVGIPEDRLDRVFDAFYGDTGDLPDIDSTGIGLAICQRIVERHGGDIWVESATGEGSTFYFTLPDEGADIEG